MYRIRDSYRQDTPEHNPFQDILRANPEYAELISAIRDRDIGYVRKLLAKNPALANFHEMEGLTPPLLMAAVSNQPEMIDALLDNGADIHVKGRWGGTALHWAAWRGSADAVDELLHRGADMNALSDNDASTPLFWACRGSREAFFGRNNHKGVVKILLDSGAAAETHNSDGFTGAAVATDEVAAILIAHGATPQPSTTQPTFGKMSPADHGWGFGFRHHSF
jgi:ankyrin repeat protein